MHLRFPGDLVVNDAGDWAQYGELILAPQLLRTPTDQVDPNDVVASGTTTTGSGNVAAVTAAENTTILSQVLLDDGRISSYPTPPPLIGPDGTVRSGSTITDLVAVLTYGYSAFRLQPAGTIPIVHAARPPVPNVGGQLRVGSLNVLNYWTSLGQWGAANSNELARQRTKLVAALSAMEADVLVLHELEANLGAPTDLLNALNAAVVVPYVLINDGVTGNATKSVLFYRPSTVTPCTPLYTLNLSVFQRPHHTQGFQVNATGGRFLVSAMHLRSKICGGGGADDQDLGDGQGCYNGTRRDQAAALMASWSDIRQSTGIEAQLAVGDMNAYSEEDPLDVLRAGGMDDLLPSGSYSYLYGGTFGALDHAFGTPMLATAVTGAATWTINSHEPPALGYADGNLALYQPNAFRCSDHDPVLVGLDALQLPMGLATAIRDNGVRVSVDGSRVNWTFPASELNDELHLLDMWGREVKVVLVNASTVSLDRSGLASGVYGWRIGTGTAALSGRLVLP
jgi:predicted extracellular nuclease